MLDTNLTTQLRSYLTMLTTDVTLVPSPYTGDDTTRVEKSRQMDELLAEIRDRAAATDRDNAFFAEDFDALREIGYLRMLVPREFGGLGFTLEQAAQAQRRLATAAPATALGINMHHVIVGIGHTLHLRGDDRAQRIFLDAVAGEVFAFGISEAGNDSVLFDATTSAEPVAEGCHRNG